MMNIGRFVSLATFRHWRQVGAIGLGEQSIRWNNFRDLAQYFRFLEGDRSGKGNIESHRQSFFGQFVIAGKTVKNSWSGFVILRIILRQDSDYIFVGIAAMDDERFVQFDGQFNLFAKMRPLHILRRVVF